MSRLNKRHVLATAIGTIMAGTAWGQQGQIETVIVTAEFREADVQDTPIAITAISSGMLEARSQTNIFEVAAQAPNVSLQPGGASIGPSMVAFIRGIGQTDFNYALEPGVGVYIDEVYYPTLTGSLVDLLDLDRVEILRGPQGTLAGKNSIGGAIKMFSQQPGDGNDSIQLTYGSYNRVEVRGSADFELTPNLAARVAGVSKSRDGFVDRLDYGCVHPTSNVPNFSVSRLSDCKVGTEGGQQYTGGRVMLQWEPSDDFRATFSADITNDDSEAIPSVLIGVNEALTLPGGPTGPFIFPPAPPAGYPNADYPNLGFNGTYIIGRDGTPVYLTNDFVPYGANRTGNSPVNDPYVNYGTFMDPWDTDPNTHQRYSPSAIRPQTTLDHWGFSATFDWNLGDNLALKWINSYREYDASFAQDEDRTPINSQFLLQHLEHDQWSTELRLSGGGDNFDYTTGIFWFEQDGTLEANVNLFYVQFNFVHGPDPTPSSNHAAFAHVTFDLTDRMNLSAGVRYSEDEKTYVHFRRNIDGTLPAGPCAAGLPPHDISNPSNCALIGLFNQGATFADDRVDWRLALDYSLGDNSMVYVQASTGYKGGGVNPRPFILAQLLPFNNEELTAYEVGFKSLLANGNLRLNGALFYNDYTDIIMTLNPCFEATPDPTDGPGPCALPINAGTAKVPGLELELEWYVGDRWLVDASASWLDFEYKEAVAPVQLNMVPPYTPETKWSAGIQYNIPLGSGGDVGLRLDASYQSEVFVLPVNQASNRIEGYTITNARLMWGSDDGLWDAAFEVTNLTDEYYFHTLFDQFASGAGTLAGQPGWPRTYGVTLRRQF
ncbi:MAG TPA: TonB-dependent receptor [Gammaproteobacteria bacterium]|nr:TonB-dependent receptor [Gammaproteobacteria bacterium]